MFSIDFRTAAERAKEAGACEDDMQIIEQMKSWEEFYNAKK